MEAFLGRFRRKVEDGQPRTVNIFLGFFLMVNLVLGTGFLSIPYGFYHSGVLPSIITLLFISFLSWLCAIWVVETMARAQGYNDYKTGAADTTQDTKRILHFYITPSRKFEPTEMCELFVGRWMKIVYGIMLVIITFFAAMAYSTVAGSAWSVNIPFNFGSLKQCHDDDFRTNVFPEDKECGNAYRFCVFIFGCIVIFLSILPLKEQLVVQVVLGVLRFTTIGAIVLYCVVNLIGGDVIENCNNPLYEPLVNLSDYSNASITMFNETDSVETLEQIFVHFDAKSWMVSIAIYSYAHILHQAIPALTHPVKKKEWLRGYFNALFLTLASMYLLMGLVASFWFRECINETCTLNWEPLSRPGNAKALRALSYFIVLFPSVDVLSAFPLVIVTTVNNVYTVILGRDTTKDKHIKFYILQVVMKILAATLPLSVAIFVANLVTVINYAGLIGFFICFYFPVSLQLASQWKCFNAFSANAGNDEATINCTKMFSSTRMDNESASLLSEVTTQESVWVRLFAFLTSKHSSLYKTPYSLPYLSSPLCALIVGAITSTFLIITIVSLALPSD